MGQVISSLARFGRAAFATLIVMAMLVPTPERAPSDDARAFAIALGVLCAVDGSSEDAPHTGDTHCALCFLPALGGGGVAYVCPSALTSTALLQGPVPASIRLARRTAPHPARAPPPSIV